MELRGEDWENITLCFCLNVSTPKIESNDLGIVKMTGSNRRR
jgi:hypothetical protein